MIVFLAPVVEEIVKFLMTWYKKDVRAGVGVNYWVQNSVANSGTTTVDMNIGQNSGYNTVDAQETEGRTLLL